MNAQEIMIDMTCYQSQRITVVGETWEDQSLRGRALAESAGNFQKLFTGPYKEITAGYLK